MRASRPLRLWALALVVFLSACGGSKNDDSSTTAAPTPSAKYPANVPITAVVTLDASGSTTTGTGSLTYTWTLTSRPAGSVAAIGSPTAVRASLTPDIVGNYVISLAVSDGSKSQSVSFAVAAIAPPTILSDLVEPVSGVVQLSLSVDQGTSSTITWTADGVAIGTGATVGWNTTSLAAGNHVVVAQVQTQSNYAFSVNRTFQVSQSPVSFTSATITETAGSFTATVGAQSVNGILHVDATLDGVALGTLAAPNVCVGDTTGAACTSTGSNGYSFAGKVANGAHVIVITATDGAGNQLGTQLRLNVIDVQ